MAQNEILSIGHYDNVIGSVAMSFSARGSKELAALMLSASYLLVDIDDKTGNAEGQLVVSPAQFHAFQNKVLTDITQTLGLAVKASTPYSGAFRLTVMPDAAPDDWRVRLAEELGSAPYQNN